MRLGYEVSPQKKEMQKLLTRKSQKNLCNVVFLVL